tara:strand:- start:924 stop:1064 length:141 start_codon:yes stop_codon:yes gene_type:complete
MKKKLTKKEKEELDFLVPMFFMTGIIVVCYLLFIIVVLVDVVTNVI